MSSTSCRRTGPGASRPRGSSWTVTGPSFAVAAGATREGGLSIRFYLGERPGTYRIRYLVYTDGPLRRLLPESQRVSAPFTVTE
jgi:hypothetical protein